MFSNIPTCGYATAALLVGIILRFVLLRYLWSTTYNRFLRVLSYFCANHVAFPFLCQEQVLPKAGTPLALS
jgi:hypothetical protein